MTPADTRRRDKEHLARAPATSGSFRENQPAWTKGGLLRRDYGEVPVEIAEMRRVKAGKGPGSAEAHELGQGPKEQHSSHRYKLSWLGSLRLF